MDRAVHTEHSSAPRRAMRERWRLRRPASQPADAQSERDDDSVLVTPAAADFAD